MIRTIDAEAAWDLLSADQRADLCRWIDQLAGSSGTADRCYSVTLNGEGTVTLDLWCHELVSIYDDNPVNCDDPIWPGHFHGLVQIRRTYTTRTPPPHWPRHE